MSEIVICAARVSEIGQCTTVFPTFKNEETKTPGVTIPRGFMSEVWKSETPDEAK